MTRKEFLDNYWRFYFLLEERFLNSLSYVELCENNYATYSIEFVSQIREIGSEIDVIMKELCGFNQFDRKTIKDYATHILERYPDIVNQKILGNGIELVPFANWSLENAATSLEWWDAYNTIKHGRVANFSIANLKNTFKSLGALYVLNQYLLKKIADDTNDIDIPDKESTIFKMINWETRFVNDNDCVIEFYE